MLPSAADPIKKAEAGKSRSDWQASEALLLCNLEEHECIVIGGLVVHQAAVCIKLKLGHDKVRMSS
jgi:hypothetical protein